MAAKKNKTMNTDQYMADLALKERKAKLQAWLEDDPLKKKHEEARAKRITALIKRIKRHINGQIETAALVDPAAVETPEQYLIKS